MASSTVRIDILGDSKSGQAAFKGIDSAAGKTQGILGKFGSAFSGVAKIAAGFVVAQGLIALPGLLSGASKQAISLEQNARKASTVFGDSLGVVETWAKGAASGMGLTNQEAVTLAAGMADLLIPMGMTREAAAKMSTETIGLAGALSEWSGGQVTAAQASDILTKAYLGETDGLKALGISISAADVSARLATKGQEGLTGAALAQAEALAIQELIFEKSTDAQNAFATSQDDMASKQARLNALWKTAKERLATALAPAIQAVLGFMLRMATLLAQKLAPAFDKLVGFVTRAFRAFRNLGESLKNGDWSGAAKQIIDGLKGGLSKLADIGGDILGWIVDAVTGVDWGGVGTTIWDGIKGAWFALTGWGGELVTWVSDEVTGVDWAGAATSLWDGLKGAWFTLTGWGGDATAWLVGVFDGIDWTGSAISLWDGIKGAWFALTGWGVDLTNWLVGVFDGIEWTASATSLWNGIKGAWFSLVGWGTDLTNWITGVFTSVDWTGSATSLWDGIKNAWFSLVDWGTAAVEWVRTTFAAVQWTAAAEALRDGISGAASTIDWTSLAEAISTGLQNAKGSKAGGFFADLFGDVQSQIEPIITALQPFFNLWSTQFLEIIESYRDTFASLMDIFKDEENQEAIGNITEALGTLALIVGGVLLLAVTGLILQIRIFSEVMQTVLPPAVQIAIDILNGMALIVNGLREVIVGMVKVVTDLIHGDWSSAWTNAGTIVQGAVDIITGIIKVSLVGVALSVLKAFGLDVVGIFTGLVRDVTTAMAELARGVMESLSGLAEDAGGSALEIGQSILSGIVSPLSGIYTAAVNAGSSFIQGLIDGITSLYDTLKGWADKVAGLLEIDVPGFSPPYHAGYEQGYAFTKGLSDGVADGTPMVGGAIGTVAGQFGVIGQGPIGGGGGVIGQGPIGGVPTSPPGPGTPHIPGGPKPGAPWTPPTPKPNPLDTLPHHTGHSTTGGGIHRGVGLGGLRGPVLLVMDASELVRYFGDEIVRQMGGAG